MVPAMTVSEAESKLRKAEADRAAAAAEAASLSSTAGQARAAAEGRIAQVSGRGNFNADLAACHIHGWTLSTLF